MYYVLEQDEMQRIHRAARQVSEARAGKQAPNARPQARSLIDRTWSSTKKSKLSQNFGTRQPLLLGFRHFSPPFPLLPSWMYVFSFTHEKQS